MTLYEYATAMISLYSFEKISTGNNVKNCDVEWLSVLKKIFNLKYYRRVGIY